jgi:DNA-binding transcriptional ArsR family regulator
MASTLATDGDPVQYFFVLSLFVPSKVPSERDLWDVVKLNPIDGLPEWKGRRVVTERQKARAAKRARRFVMVEWGELTAAFRTAGTDRATRLLAVLYLHRNLSKNASGWIAPDQKDLIAIAIADSHLSRTVAKLEALGLVEVQRRPGKRPLLRLTATTSDAK